MYTDSKDQKREFILYKGVGGMGKGYYNLSVRVVGVRSLYVLVVIWYHLGLAFALGTPVISKLR